MTREFKPAWIVGLVLVGLVAVMLLLRTSEEMAPELITAHVAVQVAGSPVARIGPVQASAGDAFELLAVVEARDWRGRTLYYSDAEALEIDGAAVDTDSIRAWNRRERLRILWFTVEGAPPYAEVSTVEDLERRRYREVFQADWPQAWSVPGRLVPAVENFLPDNEERKLSPRFGVQRFHVRVEVFGPQSDLLPSQRLRSPGAEELEAGTGDVAKLTVTLDPPLEGVSRFFGLPQVEPTGDASSQVVTIVAGLTDAGLLFSRVTLLRAWLDSVGLEWEELRWRAVELNGDLEWPDGAAVRAGSKIALTYEDRGEPGRLDEADLCLDFDRGATVRTLGEVFVGEGLVELAILEESTRASS